MRTKYFFYNENQGVTLFGVFLLIFIIFVTGCSPDPEPYTNPNLKENISGIIFEIGERDKPCSFIFSTTHTTGLLYYSTDNLPDSLKQDYKNVILTYELTDKFRTCTYDHPIFDLGEDSTNFQVINVLEATSL